MPNALVNGMIVLMNVAWHPSSSIGSHRMHTGPELVVKVPYGRDVCPVVAAEVGKMRERVAEAHDRVHAPCRPLPRIQSNNMGIQQRAAHRHFTAEGN
jgi:hypothetical protein